MNGFIKYAVRQIALLCIALFVGYMIGHLLRGY
jgi:hypothetical protein